MYFIRSSFYTRLSLLVLFVAALSLSACGNDNSTFGSKRDTGTGSETDTGGLGNDVGGNSDTGNTDTDTPNPDTGGTDPDTEIPNDPCLETTADQAASFAADYAQALCDKMWSCESNPTIAFFATFGGWTDKASCVDAVLAAKMTASQARAAVNSGTMKLNSCKATTCLEEIGELSCSDAETPMRENHVPFISSCYEALVGEIATGQPCTIDGQCGDREFCQPDDEKDVCGGTCGDVGLFASGQCGDIICRGDQYCTPENDVCMSRRADGAACEESYHCQFDSECLEEKCVPITSGLGAGEGCDMQSDLCSFGLICLNGSCEKPGELGDSCGFIGCGPALYCSSGGKCEAKGGANASCGDGSQCLSTYCVTGKCTDSEALCP